MADAAVVRLSVVIGDSAATDRLRRYLPDAKRILSRQFTAEPWHALCAAEDLLAEVDARREAWARAAENVADVLSPAPEPWVAEEAGP